MSEQLLRRYNLQPLSPNMVSKAPLSDWSTAAHAAAANIGSPAGIQTEGQMATLNARLGEMSRGSRNQAEAELAKLKVMAMNNKLQMAQKADSTRLGQATMDAQNELRDNAKTDPINIASEIASLGHAAGGFLGSMERSGAPDFVGKMREGLGKIFPSIAKEREKEIRNKQMLDRIKSGQADGAEIGEILVGIEDSLETLDLANRTGNSELFHSILAGLQEEMRLSAGFFNGGREPSQGGVQQW